MRHIGICGNNNVPGKENKQQIQHRNAHTHGGPESHLLSGHLRAAGERTGTECWSSRETLALCMVFFFYIRICVTSLMFYVKCVNVLIHLD